MRETTYNAKAISHGNSVSFYPFIKCYLPQLLGKAGVNIRFQNGLAIPKFNFHLEVRVCRSSSLCESDEEYPDVAV